MVESAFSFMVSIFGNKTESEDFKEQKFPFNDQFIDKDFLKNIIIVKKAAAIANKDSKELTKKQSEAIIESCKLLLKELPKVDYGMLQGGAYTALNLEVNEIISRKADEYLSKISDKPKKLTSEGIEEEKVERIISPLDHVNKSQSTNDVIPTALRLTIHSLGETLQDNLRILIGFLELKTKEFSKIKKTGRTHLQDAVSISLGDEFKAYSSLLRRSRESIINSTKLFLRVNLSGSAIGTAINVPQKYSSSVIKNLRRLTGKNLQLGSNLIDLTQNTDDFLVFSSSINDLSSSLMKICQDFRLMASGPKTGFNELVFKKVIRGSSIMPGKVNPVQIEYAQQCAMMTRGYSESVRIACENGSFELNVFLPVIAKSLINASRLLISGVKELGEAIKHVNANKERCEEYYKNCLDKTTSSIKEEGYEAVEKELQNGSEKKVEEKEKSKKK